MATHAWITLAFTASLGILPVPAVIASEPAPPHAQGLATKKGGVPVAGSPAPELLGTLLDTHTGEHLPFDAVTPDQARFDGLLADRITGQRQPIDPRLLALLRDLAAAHPGSRIEIVSGFRSPKLNEMLRKKGHHVASHSQHSLGHAVDFRIVPPPHTAEIGPPGGDSEPLSPLALEQEVRSRGWDGGTGVYLGALDRFIHVDVGPNRRWNGL